MKAINSGTDSVCVVDGDRLGLDTLCIEAVEARLEELFDIKFSSDEERRLFDIRFIEAVTGSGEELLKMNAVYSSSLFAFLFFSKVSESNPLKIGDIEYVDAFFEVKNKVYKNPSNMDVVLKSRKNELLFVECKFSEYLTPGKAIIREAYFTDKQHTLVRMLRDDSDSLLRLIGGSGDAYQIEFDGKQVYADGIKQIIAHLIGIEHYHNGDFYFNKKEDRRNGLLVKDAFKTRFIEIVFEFDGDKGDASKKETYFKATKYLLECIGDESLLSPTTYQEVLRDKNNDAYKKSLPPRFLALYGLDK